MAGNSSKIMSLRQLHLNSYNNQVSGHPTTTTKMNKFLALLALAATVQGGAISYGTVGTVGVAAPALAYQQPLLRAAAPVLRAAPVAVAQPVLRAAPVAYAQPIAKAVVAAEPFDPNPQYNYGYSVSDALTGDSKTATESRNGDLVQGQYSLVEPDGAIRTVTYTADAINGFNAVVDRSAPAVAVKTVAHAPVAVAAQPVLRAAPAIGYAQPALGLRAAPALLG